MCHTVNVQLYHMVLSKSSPLIIFINSMESTFKWSNIKLVGYEGSKYIYSIYNQLYCSAAVRKISCFGLKLETLWDNIFCMFWEMIIALVWIHICKMFFLVEFNYSDVQLLVYSCITERWYWQEHIWWIAVTYVSHLLNMGPSMATMIFILF